MYPGNNINQIALFLLICTISEASSSNSVPTKTVRERTESLTFPATLTSLTTKLTGTSTTHINGYTIKLTVLPTAPTSPQGPLKPTVQIIPTKITFANKVTEELDKKITLSFRIPGLNFDNIKDTFEKEKTGLEKQLLETFNAAGIEGLKRVEIIAFRFGSVIIDYNLIFALKTFLGQNGASSKTLKAIENVLVNRNTSLSITVNGTTFTADRKSFASQLATVKSSLMDPCILYDDVDICELRTQSRDYTCVREVKGIRCKPKCEGQDCSGHGQCTVRFPNYAAECMCKVEHTFMSTTTYTGQTCSELNQTLTQTGIIIITATVGGVLLLAVLVLIAVVVILRRKIKAMKNNIENQETQQDFDNQTRSSDETQESRYMKPYHNHENMGFGLDIEDDVDPQYAALEVRTDYTVPTIDYSTIGPTEYTRPYVPQHMRRNARFT